jgi:hypothetical protein
VTQSPGNIPSVKQPSAFLPPAMSLAALALALQAGAGIAALADVVFPEQGS